MSLNTDNITSIYDNYITIYDSMRIARRSLSEETQKFKKSTIFAKTELDESNQKMETAKKEFSDLIVLSLFASFERQLRDEISDKSSKLLEIIPNELGQSLNLLTQKEMERWRTTEIIDLFKFAVAENVRGKMKQILDYRNWIAHGKKNSAITMIPNADPKTTYGAILDFVAQIQDYYQQRP